MTANYCSNCGEALKEYAIVCANCGRPAPKENATHETEQESENVQTEQIHENEQRTPIQTKNSALALIFSIYPGLGQVYNGRFWKGIFFMISTVAGFLLLIPGIAIWILGFYDAYTEAEQINKGEKPYAEASVWEMIVFLFLPVFLVFALFAIAFILFVSLLRVY